MSNEDSHRTAQGFRNNYPTCWSSGSFLKWQWDRWRKGLPHIDAVVVSHNHYDHLDEGSVRHLAAQAGGSPRFFVLLGLKAWFVGRGIHDVVELDWWQAAAHGGVTFTLAPVQHWSARSPWDRWISPPSRSVPTSRAGSCR